MFGSLEWMIALRYLRSRRQEGFISVISIFSLLGIMLGVAALIVVMAVMNGFHQELLTRILGFNGHITFEARKGALMMDYEAHIKSVAEKPSVIAAIPLIEGQVIANTQRQTAGAFVKAIRPKDIQTKPLVYENIVAGSLDAFKGQDTILVGSALARQLGVRVEDGLTLLSPKGRSTAIGMVPRIKTYRVVGIFDTGMYQYDSTTIFMPFEAGQLYFRLPNAAQKVEVTTDNPDMSHILAFELIEAFPQFYVADWQMHHAQYFNALQIERNVMFLILTLIILVAAFNIISSLVMLVQEKSRTIAILRTMGATRGMILRVFFLCGSLIGVTGTLLGVALGVGFATNIEAIRQWLQSITGSVIFDPVIYYLSQLPAKLNSHDTVVIVCASLAISFLATLYPAWKASTYEPSEALRYE